MMPDTSPAPTKSAVPQSALPDKPSPSWLMAGVDEHRLRIQIGREGHKLWSGVPLRERASRLARAADWMLDHFDEIATVIAAENGKRPTEVIGHEIGASILNIRWLCEDGIRALEDQHIPMPAIPHRTARMQHDPWGVVLVISPWNFPLSIPLGQVIAALLAGNAVILKPSEVTPRCGRIIEQILEVCRLPPGTFGLALGDGSVGAKLVQQRPDKVFFTGSLATGRKVMASAAQFPIPVCMELGGVDAMIVLDDADIEFASSAAVWGAFFNGGQVCASIERVLVQENIRAPFIAAVVAKAQSLEPATDMGRITDPRQAKVYQAHMRDAVDRGLNVRCGGEMIRDGVFAPTVIDGEGIGDARVWREETFGPIVGVRTFRRDGEAVDLHNELWGGLTASIFTRSPKRADAIAQQLDAGLVSTNDLAGTLHAMPQLPWGGVGLAGFGRSHGVEGLVECTRTKVFEQPRGANLDFKRPWWFPYDKAQAELLRAYTTAVGARTLRPRIQALRQMGRKALQLLTRKPRL